MKFAVYTLLCALSVTAQQDARTAEKRIAERLNLRQLPDDQRAIVTRELAREIRGLPPGGHKLQYASSLANLATEGDFGRDTLQEVTTTLEMALREARATEPSNAHEQLAQLVRYEGMRVA